jgi:hypothetical protein
MENGSAPATKRDIEELRSETKQEFQQLRSELEQLHSEMSHQYNDLVERIHDGETRLLKAFYSFGEANNRLLQVEKRLNIPPTN